MEWPGNEMSSVEDMSAGAPSTAGATKLPWRPRHLEEPVSRVTGWSLGASPPRCGRAHVLHGGVRRPCGEPLVPKAGTSSPQAGQAADGRAPIREGVPDVRRKPEPRPVARHTPAARALPRK